MNGKTGIVILGISGLPFLNTAPVNKAVYISRVLRDGGFEVLILNDEIVLEDNNKDDLIKGVYNSINYEYTSASIYKRNVWLVDKFNFIISKFRKWIKLILLKKNGFKYIIFFTDGSIFKLLINRLFSATLGYKIILVYHEYRSDFQSRKGKLLYKLNDIYFDKTCFKFVDAVLPISEFLIKNLKINGCRKPLLKLPPLCDSCVYPLSAEANDLYFLFCGSAGHKDIIEFIINSFELIKSRIQIKLFLVVSGAKWQLEQLNVRINASTKSNLIVLISDLPFEELITYYSKAYALLIPLKNDLRDEARFPQKIAEYVLSGRPIISTNYGEVKFYFQDGVSALIADAYNAQLFSEKMEFAIKNKVLMNEIGENGKELGMKLFEYRNYIDPLRKIITNI